ncbi:general secretion pathway protein GspD [Winogradskyella undariae]|uniref:type II secretion system protein GspD n=1 Tax=Winogradskyella undariae TaxID=1285465 RepID=UPI00156B8390|nr:general secretion pathway protein GspD [Winogradskyella undariae]NRR91380.1 general secretion pathway protein GspD [Winogradskyella undariae]
MKKILSILLFVNFTFVFAQKEDVRIQKIKNQLTTLSVESVGLTENLKTEVSVSNISLSNFLLALAEVHKLNLNVSQELNQISISPKFPNVIVTDLLVYLCKEYNLTIDFTGNILSFKSYKEIPKTSEKRIIPISYNPNSNIISIDAKADKLYDLFKRIIDETGKNLVFSPGLENRTLTAYIQNIDFDAAMDKLAFANDLYFEKSKDGFFVFEDNTEIINTNANNSNQPRQRPVRHRNSNFLFKILDTDKQLLEVDLVNTPISDVINDIGNELNIDVFTATPLTEAGTITFKTKHISFNNLLIKIFESNSSTNPKVSNQQQFGNTQNTPTNIPNNFTFKKEDNTYFFGTENQLSVRNVEIVYLQYRSVELLSDPQGGNSTNNFNNNLKTTTNIIGQPNYNNNYSQNQNSTNTNYQNTGNNSNSPFNTTSTNNSDLLSIIPEEIKEGLEFKTDIELNSFYVSGPSTKINRFKHFIHKIDKPVPVILIEVMIIEVNKNSTTDTGVEWGIGENASETQGSIYPSTDLTLGATTVNKIIGGFNNFSGFNLGKVIPNFFATIKAMETNGDFKVLSTPKLATLNGHRANFSNGQTSYYSITDRSIIGVENPITNEIVNYVPVEAELGLTIKPSVSGDGHILLDINVIQSSFGSRIAEDAPPDINSRTFTSIIRMQDQDIAILGGLEENSKTNSGTGVPFLARIPIIKYLFSRHTRTARKSKLSVLIKPTVIY